MVLGEEILDNNYFLLIDASWAIGIKSRVCPNKIYSRVFTRIYIAIDEEKIPILQNVNTNVYMDSDDCTWN